MNPDEVGRSYDSIAERWRAPEYPLNGIPQHERALKFMKSRGYALDVGCGCNGRFIDLLRGQGFEVEGVDDFGANDQVRPGARSARAILSCGYLPMDSAAEV